MQQLTTPAAQDNTGREQYSLQDSDFQRTMVTRSAARQGAFFLPYVHPGQHLLDCGCGPGSITTDFAKLVAPGQVVGLDIGAGEIERATQRAADLGIANVQFRVGDVYALSFEDATFDAVFSNAVLDHLRDPVAALAEMHRVLKSGGVAGIRTADRDGYLFTPLDPLLEKIIREGEERKASQGVKVRIGKNIRAMMREAGFVRVQASASYDSYGTPESVKSFGESMANGTLREKDGTPRDEGLDEMAAAWRAWAASPDAFFGHALCEGLGWKE